MAHLTGGNNRKEDLGDLTWDATLPHRLTIQIGGAAPGTGSNTPNGVQTTPTVNAANPVNVTYDFKPGARGKVLTPAQLTREDVSHRQLQRLPRQARLPRRQRARRDPLLRRLPHRPARLWLQEVTSTQRLRRSAFADHVKETATVSPVTGITSYSYSPDTTSPTARCRATSRP